MSLFRKQFSRALEVFPSNTVNIPYPNVIAQGSPTNAGANLLIDANADFTSLGIEVGDTVFFDSNSQYATVVSIDSASTLTLSDDIITSPGNYTIYQGTNQGCYIFLDSESPERLFVSTSGSEEDEVRFNFFPPGQILPLQVLRISPATSGGSFIALWP